jgi:hypothetical protein
MPLYRNELTDDRLVPVVLVFTKFDLVVSKGLPNRTFSRRNLGGLPSEIVSGKYTFTRITREGRLTPLSVLSGSKVWRSHRKFSRNNDSGHHCALILYPCVAQSAKGATPNVASAACVVSGAESES